MILRTIIGVVGAIQLLAPRRVTEFWLARCCRNPEEVELKPWVFAVVRLEGLFMVGWVLWKSREELASATGSERIPGTDDGIDLGIDEDDDAGASWESTETEGTTVTEPASDVSETGEDPTTAEDRPTLTPGTRRHELASVLYHADDPLTVADFVDLSAGTDWEVGRSPASTTLYRMYNDGAVDREEGPEGSYEYWLTDAGRAVLEDADAEIEPNPFAGAEAA